MRSLVRLGCGGPGEGGGRGGEGEVGSTDLGEVKGEGEEVGLLFHWLSSLYSLQCRKGGFGGEEVEVEWMDRKVMGR